MMNTGSTIALNKITLIVGLGQTGLSVAHYLHQQGIAFAVTDSRHNPPGIDELLRCYPDCQTWFGSFETAIFTAVKCLVVSPGISIKSTPSIIAAKVNNVEIIGDVELFVRAVNTPIIAITGSNGKTTVTTLLHKMGNHSNINTQMVGNVGMACLEQLMQPEHTNIQLYILELSSFQLETTPSLHSLASVVLNICEDHLDRYDDLDDYANTKATIYKQTLNCVFNRDDSHVVRLFEQHCNKTKGAISFGLSIASANQWGLLTDSEGEEWIAKGSRSIVPVKQIKLVGRHNVSNFLVAFALADIAGIDEASMIDTACTFGGVIHRTQWLATINEVDWINDSKGTNVGASVAALSGLPNQSVLIAGGQGKGADFSPLKTVIRDKARAVILMGEDAPLIEKQLDDDMLRVYVKTMEEAVLAASKLAKKGDNVLLSPACASFDMFPNYAERGLHFIRCVEEMNHD